MTWEDLKILLIRMGMTVTDLAREIDCARPSVYLAFSERDRPGITEKIQAIYDKHNSRFNTESIAPFGRSARIFGAELPAPGEGPQKYRRPSTNTTQQLRGET